MPQPPDLFSGAGRHGGRFTLPGAFCPQPCGILCVSAFWGIKALGSEIKHGVYKYGLRRMQNEFTFFYISQDFLFIFVQFVVRLGDVKARLG